MPKTPWLYYNLDKKRAGCLIDIIYILERIPIHTITLRFITTPVPLHASTTTRIVHLIIHTK